MSTQDAFNSDRRRRGVAVWLLICCALIYAMIVLGGITRLTGSGLSMVNWNPIMGVVPPLDDAAWRDTFAEYQKFPEYQILKEEIGLNEFKRIFWIEYAHRLLGRTIGLVFLFPFLYFFATRCIQGSLAAKLGAVFLLGAVQGGLGWYMVQSGLAQDPRVSQYRLTLHLFMAVVIYGYLLWVALGLSVRDKRRPPRRVTGFHWSHVNLLLVVLMFISGGFVAGTRAGFVYNTFPHMNGYWWPPEIFILEPVWRNFFENVVTIQFVHRLGALTTAMAVGMFWILIVTRSSEPRHRTAAHWLTGVSVMQVILGVAALVFRVPVVLGVLHQAGAVALITLALYVVYVMRNASDESLPTSASAAKI